MTRYCIPILLLLLAAPALFADEKDIAPSLRQACGITDEDCRNAEKKSTVGLFDLYALAVRNTEKMKIESENVVQAEARRDQAIGSFFPKISLRATKALPGNDHGQNFSPGFRTGVLLYGRQPIITGLDEWSRLKGTKHDIRLRSYTLCYTATRLLYDIAYGYYNVLQIGTSLESRNEVLKLYTKNLQELQRRVGLGKSRQSEVLRTRSQIYKIEAEIRSLTNELERARLLLATLTGVPMEGREIRGIADIPAPADIRAKVKALVDARWDIRAASEEVKYSEAQLLAAKGGHLPSLYLEGAYRIYQPNATGPDYYFGLGAEIPIFSGGIVSAKIRESESALRQSELRLKNARRTAEQDIVDSYQSWETSGQEEEAYRRAYLAARENYQTSLNDYRYNLVTILDVITSLTSLQSAQDDYARIMLQHKLNRVRLGIATSEFSGEGIRLLRQNGTDQKKTGER